MPANCLVDRRSFLRAVGLGFMASLTSASAFALESTDAVFASGFRAPDGSFGIATLTEQGKIIYNYVLPARSHGLAFCQVTHQVAAFARRPGTFAAIFSRTRKPVMISAADGRHFFGHGCFSPDGRLLYASENDFDNNRGMIGVYDAGNGFVRIGEFAAYGIGTHDITISDDGMTLIIANGGIATHPDFGRTKLNLDHMQPSMVLVETKTGDLIEKHDMPAGLRQLSTRHADVDGQGRVWFACQFEGPSHERPPVLGYFGKGEEVTFIDLPVEIASDMANYIGAIAINRRDGQVAATSVKGGASIILDGATGGVLHHRKTPGISGVAAGPNGFVFSTLTGQFAQTRSLLNWDQHITALIPSRS